MLAVIGLYEATLTEIGKIDELAPSMLQEKIVDHLRRRGADAFDFRARGIDWQGENLFVAQSDELLTVEVFLAVVQRDLRDTFLTAIRGELAPVEALATRCFEDAKPARKHALPSAVI